MNEFIETPSPKISNEAVQMKTGKTWLQWFAILDQANANNLTHKEIAAYLHEHYTVDSWWSQMITVTYEQQRGLRKKHQKTSGYEISVSKVIERKVAELFNLWTEERLRNKWLSNSITIRKATANKSLRITWNENNTSISVEFYAKKEHKTQVVVQHSKLRDETEVIKMKLFWKTALEKLIETQ